MCVCVCVCVRFSFFDPFNKYGSGSSLVPGTELDNGYSSAINTLIRPDNVCAYTNTQTGGSAMKIAEEKLRLA